MRDWLVIAIGIGFLFAILPNIYAQESIPSPLKQFKAGIMIQDIKCKEGLVLAIKESTNRPSCIKPTSEQRLLTHGWIIPKFETKQVIGNNGTVTPSMINKWYQDWQSGHPDPHHEVSGTLPLSVLQISPTMSSSSSHSPIKILMIGMSPNPLKVGDMPQFTLTFQNISDKPIYVQSGCGATPVGFALFPSDNVIVGVSTERLGKCPIGPVIINPNQIETDYSSACPMCEQVDLKTMPSNLDFGGLFYQITKLGTLHVTMKLVLRHELNGNYDQMETIQFNVNATSSSDIVQNNETGRIFNQTNNNNSTVTSTLKSSPITWTLVSMTKPELKIISVEMTPNPLKVGDKPEFTVTYQNISDKTILQAHKWCNTNPSMHWQISPLSNVQVQRIVDNGMRCPSTAENVKPSETYVADGYGAGNVIYQITKAGELDVTLDIDLGDGSGSGIQATVQFKVNVTK